MNPELIAKLDLYLNDLKIRWTQSSPQSWIISESTFLNYSSNFTINALDEIITYIEQLMPKESDNDKKEAVMAMMTNLFNHIATSAPIWFKPFMPTIKNAVNITINNLFDYITNKYESGYWEENNA